MVYKRLPAPFFLLPFILHHFLFKICPFSERVSGFPGREWLPQVTPESAYKKCVGGSSVLHQEKSKNLNTLHGSSSPHGEVGQSCPGHLINRLFLLAYFRIWWNQSFLGDQIHYWGPGIQSSQAVCKIRRNLTSCDLFNTPSSSSSTPANFAFE